MRKYTDLKTLKKLALDGKSLDDIASVFNVSKYTISRYYTDMVNNLSINEILKYANKHHDLRKLISPKTKKYKQIVNDTAYLSTSSSIRQRLWHLKHNTSKIPTCAQCDSPVRWEKDTQQYRTYCSIQCQGSSDVVKSNRKQTTKERLGVEYPSQHSDVQKKYKNTMIERYGVPFANQQHIPQQSRLILSDKDNLQLVYDRLKTTHRVADHLNVCQSLVSRRGRELGVTFNNSSGVEEDIYDFLLEEFPTLKIERNSRRVIPPLELDFYFPDHNIAIEVNGLFWHSEKQGKTKDYHLNKLNECSNKNIRLIQLYDQEWVERKELIKSRLRIILQSSSVERIYARNCLVDIIPAKQSNSFIKHRHIQSSCPASIHIGIFYANSLVGCMSFRKPRFNNRYQYELIRFATEYNTVIVGGASKMIAHFIRTYDPTSIISYSDKRWNTGNVYTQTGFKFSHSTKPNYWYFDASMRLRSRVGFQKHKLKDKLNTFDPTASEWTNMINNGYDRIWDCGNDVFTWTPP